MKLKLAMTLSMILLASAGAVTQALKPLRRISTALDVAVTVTRHNRKSGGGIGESGRGSSAFTGFVDSILQLRRLPGNRCLSKRRLEITGRIEQKYLIIEMEGNKYEVARDKDVQDSASEVERLVQAMAKNPRASGRELEKITGIGRNRVKNVASQAGFSRGASGWTRDSS